MSSFESSIVGHVGCPMHTLVTLGTVEIFQLWQEQIIRQAQEHLPGKNTFVPEDTFLEIKLQVSLNEAERTLVINDRATKDKKVSEVQEDIATAAASTWRVRQPLSFHCFHWSTAGVFKTY